MNMVKSKEKIHLPNMNKKGKKTQRALKKRKKNSSK